MQLFISPNADHRIMKIWNYITFFSHQAWICFFSFSGAEISAGLDGNGQIKKITWCQLEQTSNTFTQSRQTLRIPFWHFTRCTQIVCNNMCRKLLWNRIVSSEQWKKTHTLILSNKIWVNENLNGILWQTMRVPDCNLYAWIEK